MYIAREPSPSPDLFTSKLMAHNVHCPGSNPIQLVHCPQMSLELALKYTDVYVLHVVHAQAPQWAFSMTGITIHIHKKTQTSPPICNPQEIEWKMTSVDNLWSNTLKLSFLCWTRFWPLTHVKIKSPSWKPKSELIKMHENILQMQVNANNITKWPHKTGGHPHTQGYWPSQNSAPTKPECRVFCPHKTGLPISEVGSGYK